MKFQWYQNGIKTVKPSGFISLEQFVQDVINPKPNMILAFELIQNAKNKAEKDQLKKEKLFFTTPSVIVNPIRNYNSIQEFLPFAVLEYDNIEYAEELRDYIFEKKPECIFAFTSPSKTGAKFIFNIEKPKDLKDYKQLYYGLAYDLDKFKGLDLSNRNAVLPLFNSYDKDAKFRFDAPASTQRGYCETDFIPPKITEKPLEQPKEKDQKECIRLCNNVFDKITDNGHPQCLKASFTLGGLAAFYSVIDMWFYIEQAINRNSYMSKDTKGYLRTAKEMFNKGLQSPTPLKNENNRTKT